ncbi:insulinase family protein [Streptomyces sp. MS06]|uniref:insulinase family protein n=1 Tax=Streptomyces sp. MS06 TaxID=3385974 RepID=UPI0039A023BB
MTGDDRTEQRPTMNPQAALHLTEVDGIPTLFAHSAGPMRAGLVFRVGVADETLARTGVTHLVEHLALHRMGLAAHDFNGATKAAFTHFLMEGTEAEVVAYLHGVCASLADLPMDRLETEKDILRTEESRRENPQLPLWRYGAQGYGLVSYPEWGVPGLRPDDVRHWARSWFTQGNAVLWIAGERLPAGLSVKLAPGERRALPAVTSALPVTPAYFSDGKGGVLLDAVVTAGTAAEVYAGVLERALSRALRQEGGYSYTAATDYASRRDGFARVAAFADSLPAKQDAVLGGFVDVLAALQAGRVGQDEVEAVRSRADAALTAPDAAVRRLVGAAEDLLVGRAPRSVEEMRAELWQVTPEQVHAVALEAAGTALMQVPAGHRADWAGYTEAPSTSPYTVTGRRFGAGRGGDPALVIGAEGVSLVAREADGTETAATVSYRACAAVLRWPDGGRRLIGTDGIVVDVEPGPYGVDAHTMATFDAAVPPSAVVLLPPRQQRPVPETAASPAGGGTAAAADGTARGGSSAAPRRRTAGQTAAVVVLGLLAGLFALIALSTTLFGNDPETGGTGVWVGTAVFLWVVTGLLVWPVVRILRRTRRG